LLAEGHRISLTYEVDTSVVDLDDDLCRAWGKRKSCLLYHLHTTSLGRWFVNFYYNVQIKRRTWGMVNASVVSGIDMTADEKDEDRRVVFVASWKES
jgi:hypothetical protein